MERGRWIGMAAALLIFSVCAKASAQVKLYSGGQNCVAEAGQQNAVAYGEPGIGNLRTDVSRTVWCPAPRMPQDGLYFVDSITLYYLNRNTSIRIDCYPFLTTYDLQYQWGPTLFAPNPPPLGTSSLSWFRPFGVRRMSQGDIIGTGLRCRIPPGNNWLIGYQYTMKNFL